MARSNLQPTYKRQRFLLAFIRQLQSGVTATDLQKLVFLYTMKENSEFYEFIPYKYGSYSFQLAEDVDILRKDGYLKIEDSHICSIDGYPDEIFSIEKERGKNLIRKAYREYPYYAINSEIIDRIFQEEEAEKLKKTRQNYTQSENILFTIGYEGESIEAFLNKLIKNDVRILVDVRKNPLSRKFGFSKNKLKHIIENIGIKYIHIPELGIESDKRSSLETAEDYYNLFNDYAETLPGLKPQIERVYSLLGTDIRIALMCYEKEPEMCHRHVIRDYLVNSYKIRSIDI